MVVSIETLMRRRRRFVAPRFQRPFAWTDNQVGRLMEDLANAFARSQRYYFVGSVTFLDDEGDAVEIVDGQQRLATFTMIAAALRDRLADRWAERLGAWLRDGDGNGRLLLRPADRAFFARHVQSSGVAAAARPAEDLSEPQLLILNALGAIARALDALPPQEIPGFAEFLCERVLLNVIETDDRAGAPHLFVVMNQSGGDLSAADLIKAWLFEQANLPDDEAEAAAQRWDALLDALERKGLDELLAFMPAITRRQSGRQPKGFESLRQGFLRDVDPATFLTRDIHRYADAVIAIRHAQVDAGEASAAVNRRIGCLHMLPPSSQDWLPAAVAAVADHEGPKERLLPFFDGLERLAYACFLSVLPPHTHLARYARVLEARNDPHALFGPNGALELTPREKRDMIMRLNGVFSENAKRRALLLRINAALPRGEVYARRVDATVEHILPLGAAAGAYRAFDQSSNRARLVNMLGNLTLVTNDQNRRCANKPYAIKRPILIDRQCEPSFAMTRMLQDYKDWTPDALGERQQALTSAIIEDWRLIDER